MELLTMTFCHASKLNLKQKDKRGSEVKLELGNEGGLSAHSFVHLGNETEMDVLEDCSIINVQFLMINQLDRQAEVQK